MFENLAFLTGKPRDEHRRLYDLDKYENNVPFHNIEIEFRHALRETEILNFDFWKRVMEEGKGKMEKYYWTHGMWGPNMLDHQQLTDSCYF